MKRYLMRLSYDGTDFSGWQVQPDVRTVQKVIENAFFAIAERAVAVTASGRTDAGVHARNQYAHFDLDMKITPEQLTKALNSKLPADIYIKDIIAVNPDFSARYDAVKRSYQYIITQHYDPFKRNYKSYLPKFKIHPEIMRACLNAFLGENDFTSFSKHNPDLKHKFCTIYELNLTETETDLRFNITANRFLHNMVRRMIGTLLNISHFKLEPALVKDLITAKDPRNKLIYTAPAQGLYLTDVLYRSIKFK